MLEKAKNHIFRFLSESSKVLWGSYYFVLLVSRDQEKTFLEKKIFRTHFWTNFEQKKANGETKKVKNGKNGDNKIWLSFSKNEAMTSFFFVKVRQNI